MVSWAEFAGEHPDLAQRVRACFARGKHCTLATLRRDGAPRISGSEVEFDGGEIWLGSMPGAVKALDLRRDPRLALHSPTEDPPESAPGEWGGEAKLAGVAHEEPGGEPGAAHRFRVELTEVVLTGLGASGDHLVIESWHPGRGLEVRRR